jgi:acetyl-CoA acetyltransferase
LVQIAERETVISGVGISQTGRRLNRTAMDLTLEAADAAIADAGLTRADIDGLATFHFDTRMGLHEGAETDDVQDALRLDLNWFLAVHEHSAMLSAVVDAALAVAAGLARHVLIYRTVRESSDLRAAKGFGFFNTARPSSYLQWLLPFGAMSAGIWTALNTMRYFHDYGLTREQLGQLALTFRRNASLNPEALYRTPLTIEDYLSSRMIMDPLCLFDCDVPMDGSACVIVSPVAYAKDAPNPCVQLNAVGTAMHGRPTWDQRDDFPVMGFEAAASQMWSRTDLKPADVDLCNLYDGFSFFVLSCLEALGFCSRGESGAFIEDGSRIALNGELPLNTGGGQLSGGRLHGMGLLRETVLQLRGEAGQRQVTSAEVGIATHHGGPFATSMLLNVWRG